MHKKERIIHNFEGHVRLLPCTKFQGIELPECITKRLDKRRKTVTAVLNGRRYRGKLVGPIQERHFMVVSKAIHQKVQEITNGPVQVSIETPAIEPEIFALPQDFEAALERNYKARMFWPRLTEKTRKRHLEWIASSVRDDTRQRRIMHIVHQLAAGKRGR